MRESCVRRGRVGWLRDREQLVQRVVLSSSRAPVHSSCTFGGRLDPYARASSSLDGMRAVFHLTVPWGPSSVDAIRDAPSFDRVRGACDGGIAATRAISPMPSQDSLRVFLPDSMLLHRHCFWVFKVLCLQNASGLTVSAQSVPWGVVHALYRESEVDFGVDSLDSYMARLEHYVFGGFRRVHWTLMWDGKLIHEEYVLGRCFGFVLVPHAFHRS